MKIFLFLYFLLFSFSKIPLSHFFLGGGSLTRWWGLVLAYVTYSISFFSTCAISNHHFETNRFYVLNFIGINNTWFFLKDFVSKLNIYLVFFFFSLPFLLIFLFSPALFFFSLFFFFPLLPFFFLSFFFHHMIFSFLSLLLSILLFFLLSPPVSYKMIDCVCLLQNQFFKLLEFD